MPSVTSDQFPIACVCGSMRYYDDMLIAARHLSLSGYIVVFPFMVFKPGSEQESDAKQMLDIMHQAKIDMSELVVIVTDNTRYWGESTTREIAYAKEHGKYLQIAQVWNRKAQYVTLSSFESIARGKWRA